MSQSVQLLGISNAIVDVLAHVDEEFLKKVGVPRGAMTLIDEARAHELYDMMGPATEMSGGSVANTVAGFAILGGVDDFSVDEISGRCGLLSDRRYRPVGGGRRVVRAVNFINRKVIAPRGTPTFSRNASSTWASTSTMALLMPRSCTD